MPGRSGMNQWLGRGSINSNGVGLKELSAAMRSTLRSAGSVSRTSSDRGLTRPSSKQTKAANIGPGSYHNEAKLSFPSPHTAS